MRDAPSVPIDLEFLGETRSGLAAEFRDEDGNEFYLPLSQLPAFNPQDHEDGDFVRVDVPEWLAKDKGLI